MRLASMNSAVDADACGKDLVHEGILGAVFTGRLVENTRIGDICGAAAG